MLGTTTVTPHVWVHPWVYDGAVSLGGLVAPAWAGFLENMSKSTKVTALLLASLPCGLALPQAIPLNGDVAPITLPLAPGVDGIVVDFITGAVDGVKETVPSALLESVTDAVSDVVSEDDSSTGAAPTLGPEANILPLILPGKPSGSFSLIDDLPAPNEVPYDDGGLIADLFDPSLIDEVVPYPMPSFGPEETVPISTFNAVVQPLLSVIQALINSLPGNLLPSNGVLVDPLLPSGKPDIFIDPILPTESVFYDAVATPTDAVLSLDAAATLSLPALEKRQVPEIPADASTDSLLSLIRPILDIINALLEQIPGVGSALEAATPDAVAPELPDLSVDVPALPVDPPALPISNNTVPPNTTLPDLSLPTDVSVVVEAPVIPSLPVETPVVPEHKRYLGYCRYRRGSAGNGGKSIANCRQDIANSRCNARQNTG